MKAFSGNVSKYGTAGLFVVLFLAALSIIVWLSYLNRNYQLDDSLIYSRYVRNLLHGDGLVYNKGFYHNALTSPLYVYLLAGVSYTLGSIQVAHVALSGLFLALTVVIWATVFMPRISPFAAAYGAILIACSNYFYSTFGMETTLFLFNCGLCIYLFERKNDFFLGVACATLLLTRAEGIFLIAALGIEYFRQGRSFPYLYCFIIPALLLGAYLVFNLAYYGTLMPNSATAKILQGASGMWGRWPTAFLRVKYHFSAYWGPNPMVLSGWVILAAYGFFEMGYDSLNVILGTFMLMLSAFYILFNIPNYSWYYGPYYALLCFYAGAGISRLWVKFAAIDKFYLRSSLKIVIVVVAVFLPYRSLDFAQRQCLHAGPHEGYREIGIWLKENTPVTSSVAAAEIGTIGWYSERNVVDIIGLVTPRNARLISKGDLESWLVSAKPDYVIAHNPIWSWEAVMDMAATKGEYRRFEWTDRPGYCIYVKN